MNEDLARTLVLKNPAVIVRAQRPAGLMVAGPRERHLLAARAAKLERRGAIAVEWDAPRWNQRAGRYELKVRALKDPVPPWRKRAILAGAVLAALLALGWLAWHAMEALTSSALGLFVLAVLGTFLVMLIKGHRTYVQVTTSTTTKVSVRR